MKRTAHYLVLALLFAFSYAFAQGERFETGTLTATVGGEELRLRSYFTAVPEDVADGVTDPQQRAILERVAGTEQHTATFKHFDAMTMGAMVLVPAKVHVGLRFAYGDLDLRLPGSIAVMFSLEPETLELGALADVEISYYPNGTSYSDYYALTEGGLTLEAVEVLDANTLRISGSFSGTFTHQDDYDKVHNPDDAIPGSATFTVERVVGDGLALELIQGR